MTTTTFHSSYSLNTFSRGYRKNNKETIFSVEVYGEDGDYESFEVMAENKEMAREIAEREAQSRMTDICYVAIYAMN